MAASVHYLEIVSLDVEATCKVLAATHNVVFSPPIAELGNARVTGLVGGGRMSVRGVLSNTEQPVVRPYVLVADIGAAWDKVLRAGAKEAHPPLKLPGQGTFAIYEVGGVQHGLWQNEC